MAESSFQLPVSLDQEYRVKLGRSFTFPKENSFHTIKYDFKPKSVDSSKPGRMKVNGEEVSVSLPTMQAESADDVVLFKGAKRTCTKECILIINTLTGEAVLEKISNSVQLKGVRDPKKKKQPRSVSPLPPQIKSTTTSTMTASKTGMTSTKPNYMTNDGTAAATKKKTKQPKKPVKEGKTKNSKSTNKAVPTSSQAALAPPPTSSTSLLTMPSLPESISPLRSNNPTPEPPLLIPPPPSKKVRTGSSPSNASSSSSDTDSSDLDVEFTTVQKPPPASFPSMPQFTSVPPVNVDVPAVIHGSHMTSHMTTSMGQTVGTMAKGEGEANLSDSSSSSDSSDDEGSSSSDSSGKETIPSHPVVTAAHSTVIDVRPRTMSMLRHDLELSESDSD